MRSVLPGPLAFLCTLLAFVATACTDLADRRGMSLYDWDEIVTVELAGPGPALAREILEQADERVYSLYPADGGRGLSIAIAVARGGSRLPVAEWQQAFAAAEGTIRERDFPSIGARARVATPRFSPDGALSGVTFTTRDGAFDVVVSLLEEGGGGPRQEITAIELARRIETAYQVRAD